MTHHEEVDELNGQVSFAGVITTGVRADYQAVGKQEANFEGAEALRPGDRIRTTTEYVVVHSGVDEKHDKMGWGTGKPKLTHVAKPIAQEVIGVTRRADRDADWERQHGKPG